MLEQNISNTIQRISRRIHMGRNPVNCRQSWEVNLRHSKLRLRPFLALCDTNAKQCSRLAPRQQRCRLLYRHGICRWSSSQINQLQRRSSKTMQYTRFRSPSQRPANSTIPYHHIHIARGFHAIGDTKEEFHLFIHHETRQPSQRHNQSTQTNCD